MSADLGERGLSALHYKLGLEAEIQVRLDEAQAMFPGLDLQPHKPTRSHSTANKLRLDLREKAIEAQEVLGMSEEDIEYQFRRIRGASYTRALAAQGSRCLICDQTIYSELYRDRVWDERAASREHVFPKSKAGIVGHFAANIGMTHNYCNRRRGSLLPTPTMIERHETALRKRNGPDYRIWCEIVRPVCERLIG